MQHFPIIKSISRTALVNPTPALKKQIDRLVKALQKDGDVKEASDLEELLIGSSTARNMAPSTLIRSLLEVPGETLTASTPIPVDKETSSPLAEVIFSSEKEAERPLFDENVTVAVDSILKQWTNANAFESHGLQPYRTCLIYGEPGVGKTHLARWLGHQLEMPIVLVRLDGLISSFLGTTARNIKSLFAFVNRYRCILLLDEFDAIAKHRDDPQEVGEIKRVVNALLQNLDQRYPIGITIGITNHQKLLDSAIWRRFDVQLEIPLPQFSQRLSLTKKFMSPHEVSETRLKLIAWLAEGCAGAEIETLVRMYKVATLIDKADFLKTLKQYTTLNSNRISESRKLSLNGMHTQFLSDLQSSEDPKFSLQEIGEIIEKDKSSVSRMLSKLRK